MARGVFDLLLTVDAKLFACAIPRGTKPPPGYTATDHLRRDHAELFERFYWFLEAEAQHGLVVMDQSERSLDLAFVRRMEAYFTRTAAGRNRAYRIVPAPLFVPSDMSYPVQAADICLYCINWGFRPAAWGELATRPEIMAEFGPKITRLEWSGQGSRDGQIFRSRGVTLVADPYGAGHEKGGNAPANTPKGTARSEPPQLI